MGYCSLWLTVTSGSSQPICCCGCKRTDEKCLWLLFWLCCKAALQELLKKKKVWSALAVFWPWYMLSNSFNSHSESCAPGQLATLSSCSHCPSCFFSVSVRAESTEMNVCLFLSHCSSDMAAAMWWIGKGKQHFRVLKQGGIEFWVRAFNSGEEQCD